MSVRRRSLLLLLPVLALLALPGAAPAAKTRHQPRSYWITAQLPKENGWSISISGIFGGQIKGQDVSVSANGPGHVSVAYEVHGHLAADGAMAAKFPGIGLVELSFRKTGEDEASSSDEGCTNDGRPHSYKGTFSGVVELDGDGSFGKADRRSATGSVFETPPETCTVETHRHTGAGELPGSLIHTQILHAGRRLDGGTFGFDATTFEAGLGIGGKLPPTINFSAYYLRRGHGMTTDVEASAEGKPSQFSFASAGGEPSETTVEPPAPFSGSATFKLESPKVASWTGDLRIDLPLLGEVELTGPSFRSALCEGVTCTPTTSGLAILSRPLPRE